MSLHLHRAERTDRLADALADELAVPPADPFAGELVVVPAKGVERWLSQRLSHRLGAGPAGDGVCAGVEFRHPRSLIGTVTRVGMADDEVDPWTSDALVWPVLGVIDDSLGEPWCRVLARHLGYEHQGEEAELRRGRRHSVAARLARLLASYAVQRPLLLEQWLSGPGPDGDEGDGTADGHLDADLHWQAELWRRVVHRVGEPAPHLRQAELVRRLRAEPDAVDLPQRLSLFGHTRLARAETELVVALAEQRDVHLWLPHPCDPLWQRLTTLGGEAVVERAEDTSGLQVEHPLLVTLGRDLRELQRGLIGAAPATDEYLPPTTPGDRSDTLLGWLQEDLRAGAPQPDGRVVAPSDRSVQVHACHGPARQVEVLREVLLGLLEDDPTLQLRDILVMAPDIETYAPLISATFGGLPADAGDEQRFHPGQALPVRLADRSLTQTNDLLAVAERLLDLAGGRAGASEVLDLLHAPVVRRRFGFSDDDLETIGEWVRDSGVRWGFDAQARAPYGLDGVVNNTWQFGLDRILAGVAVSDDAGAWFGPTLPLDEVGSDRVDLAGRLAEALGRLQETTGRLDGSRRLADWLGALEAGVAAIAETDADNAWQSAQLRREFAALADDAAADAELRLSDIRSLLSDALQGRPTRANFRTGALTVCTMVPMRSVPHRVVCLLGVDDGVFPRQTIHDGDDVLARRPLTGERDLRSEDRQLLLDALGAATDTLVVTYTGADEHSGAERTPAVPLGELMDALDRTTEAPVRDRILVRHPLQSFDPRNLTDGALGPDGAFTFDPIAADAARVVQTDREPPPGLLDAPLPPSDDGGVVPLASLRDFLRDPVRGFFRRLELSLPWDHPVVSDQMPVEQDGLERWGSGDRMLADMLRRTHPETARQAEWRRGTLPPGQLGWQQAARIRDGAEALARAAFSEYGQADERSVDVDVPLPPGPDGAPRSLTGTITGLRGHKLVSVSYSRLDGRQRMRAWVDLLALTLNDPDRNWTSVAIGRPARGDHPARSLVGPIPEPVARQALDLLIAIYDAGRREPLPLPGKASYAWAQAWHTHDDPLPAAERKWSPAKWSGENAEPSQVRVWGEHAPLSRLLEQKPRAGEECDGQESRLGALSVRMWGPMLKAEARR